MIDITNLTNITSNYALKGSSYTKEDILSACIDTINDKFVSLAIFVLCVICITPIIKWYGLQYMADNGDDNKKSHQIIVDFLQNINIIDYVVMAFFCIYIIVLSVSH